MAGYPAPSLLSEHLLSRAALSPAILAKPKPKADIMKFFLGAGLGGCGERGLVGRKSSHQQLEAPGPRRCRISELDASDPGWSVRSASHLHMASAELGSVGLLAAQGGPWARGQEGVRSRSEGSVGWSGGCVRCSRVVYSQQG